MRLEDALEITERLANKLDEDSDPAAFSLEHGPLEPAPHVGVGVSMGPSARDVRIAVRGWTKQDILLFEAVSLAPLSLPRSELDVAVTGEIYAGPVALGAGTGQFTTRCRPVHPGVSIGHISGTTGTLGALVEVDGPVGTELHMLSCNHVLANCVGDRDPDAAAIGDEIVQQSIMDGGAPPPVGRLSKVQPLQARGNQVDAALARCDEQLDWGHLVPGIGAISGIVSATLGTEVQKVGRSTGHRNGRIRAYHLRSIPVRYPSGVCRFDDVIEVADMTTRFSERGDSGAVIVDRDRAAIGLLFAGIPGVTFANPMSRVQTALGFSQFKGA